MVNKDNLVKKEYLVYLDEIRSRIVRLVIIFLAAGVLGLIFSNKILTFFLKIFNFSGVNVVMTSPAQLIDLSVHTGLICGFLAILPIFIYQMINFIKPAFNQNEYKIIKKLLPISAVLFLSGMVFGAWVTQFVITMYSEFSKSFNVNNIWDIQTFFFQVVVTAVLMGIVFEIPVFVTILIRMKLITRKFLVKKRKYVYAAIIIFAVLMPPTDIISLTLLTVPLWLLFEVALLLNKDY